MTGAELEGRVVERRPLIGHVGKSGATLERWLLDDGTRLVAKRFTPATDLLMTLTGDSVGREYTMWDSGLLRLLPEGVGHAIVDGWREPDGSVVVMRDLRNEVLGWEDRLDDEHCRWALRRVAAMHQAFQDVPLDPWPEALTPLPTFLALFSPDRLRPHLDGASKLPRLATRGWAHFAEMVPSDVGDPVLALLRRPEPLAEALRRRPCTLAHGDLATVNMAVESDVLVLLDWGMPVSAPGAVDVARFVAGCSSVVDLSREEVLSTYADALGPAYDEAAMHLALLAGTVWLGWNKALDAAEHPDPAVRAREREDLDWWVAEARTTIRSGLL
ncbi:MAG: hypothetical protein ACM3XQ_12170 [Nocardioidaceae bacterium]